MKNRPLQGGEASLSKALDATKATGCGFLDYGDGSLQRCWRLEGLNLLGRHTVRLLSERKQKAELYRGAACQHLAA